MIKFIKGLFGCKHNWQEYIQEVTLDRSRECLKCGKKQKWAGYWKTKK